MALDDFAGHFERVRRSGDLEGVYCRVLSEGRHAARSPMACLGSCQAGRDLCPGSGIRMSTAPLSYAAAVLAMLTGLLALLGWALGMPVFYTTIPGLPAMTQVTAIGGGADRGGAAALRWRFAAIAQEYCPCLCFRCPGGRRRCSVCAGWLPPPSPATSIVLALLGIALLLLQASRPPVLALGALSVFALTLPLCRLTELLLTLGNDRHVAARFFATTSLNSALALCLLAGPALFLHPRLPFGRILFSSKPSPN